MPYFEITSAPYLTILIVYFFISAIKMFDLRMLQARQGKMGEDLAIIMRLEPALPRWVDAVYIVDWILGLTLLILNWKVTVVIFILRFVLKVLPVLETVGNLLMRPFRPQRPVGLTDDDVLAGYWVKLLSETSTENKLWSELYDTTMEHLTRIAETVDARDRLETAIKYVGGNRNAMAYGYELLQSRLRH